MIQEHIVKRGKRTIFSQFLHPKKDEDLIVSWKLDLHKICLVFDVRAVASV